VTEKHDLASAEPGRVKQMAEVLAATHREVKAEGPNWPGSPG
jgi:hypothetical protein